MAKHMNIQALIFDLDGTAIPFRPDGMPNQAVIEAVKKAKEICHVSVATGRPLGMSEAILAALDIDDLCILNGGTHIYSRKTKEFIWKQEVDELTLQQIFSKLTDVGDLEVDDENLIRVPLSRYRPTKPVGLVCIHEASREEADKIVAAAAGFTGIKVIVVASWGGAFDIHITHELATKKHAIQALLAHLNVHIDNVMVVGDGNNDLPMFELSGLKIAMGNAAEELKAKADWIAPSVDEDGLAVAINKFILGL